ncbi:CDP-diacylglycerol--glycerol-3-phosphate 3-phosphatidyltransferase [bacterium]|nr:CDP-diacylglycerol--glycerol-3-phosphate 3-phosphatidyltransferase [bacterium]
MNLANRLTIIRIVIAPIFIVLLLTDGAGTKSSALLLFIIASLTDFYDGRIARVRGVVTSFGKFMDPLADKIIVLGALICFVALGEVWAWMVIIILAREVMITHLRFIGASKGIIIPAGRWGKHKTATQMIAVSVTLVVIAINSTFASLSSINAPSFLSLILKYTPNVLVGLAVIMTIISGVLYVGKHREVLIKRE